MIKIKEWTEDDDRFIKSLKGKYLKEFYNSFPNRTKASVRGRIRKFNIEYFPDSNYKKNNNFINCRKGNTYFRKIKITEDTNTILLALMRLNNITTKILAEKIGVNIRTVRAIIQGRNPNKKNKIKISEVFNIPATVIFWKYE